MPKFTEVEKNWGSNAKLMFASIDLMVGSSPKVMYHNPFPIADVFKMLRGEIQGWEIFCSSVDAVEFWSQCKELVLKCAIAEHGACSKVLEFEDKLLKYRPQLNEESLQLMQGWLAEIVGWKKTCRSGFTEQAEENMVNLVEDTMRAATKDYESNEGDDENLRLRRARSLEPFSHQVLDVVFGKKPNAAELECIAQIKAKVRNLVKQVSQETKEIGVLNALDHYSSEQSEEHLATLKTSLLEAKNTVFSQAQHVNVINKGIATFTEQVSQQTHELQIPEDGLAAMNKEWIEKHRSYVNYTVQVCNLLQSRNAEQETLQMVCMFRKDLLNLLLSSTALAEASDNLQKEQRKVGDGIKFWKKVHSLKESVENLDGWDGIEDGEKVRVSILEEYGVVMTAVTTEYMGYPSAHLEYWQDEKGQAMEGLMKLKGGLVSGGSWRADLGDKSTRTEIMSVASDTLFAKFNKGISGKLAKSRSKVLSILTRMANERKVFGRCGERWASNQDFAAMKLADEAVAAEAGTTIVEAMFLQHLREKDVLDTIRIANFQSALAQANELEVKVTMLYQPLYEWVTEIIYG